MHPQVGNTPHLVAAIAAGRSLPEAAEAAGMSVRTAQRRLRESEVLLLLDEARADLTRQAVGELASLRLVAFGRVRQVLEESEEPAHILRASDLVLRHMAAADLVAVRETLVAVGLEVADLHAHIADLQAHIATMQDAAR